MNKTATPKANYLKTEDCWTKKQCLVYITLWLRELYGSLAEAIQLGDEEEDKLSFWVRLSPEHTFDDNMTYRYKVAKGEYIILDGSGPLAIRDEETFNLFYDA